MTNESYIVTEIRNIENELLNPMDKIVEHIPETGSKVLIVQAILSTTFPVDRWENPERGDWLNFAYIKSNIGSQWEKEIGAWRKSFNVIQKSGGNTAFPPSILSPRRLEGKSNLISIGFDFTENDISTAFDLDWGKMDWDSWLPMSHNQKSMLGDCLKSNYSLICNLFAHYSGVGQVGQRYGLSMQEFGHLLHFMQLYNFKTNKDFIEEIFNRTNNSKTNLNQNQSNIALKTQPNSIATPVTATMGKSASHQAAINWPLMSRSHLTQALVCVAIEMHMGETPVKAMNAFIKDGLEKIWIKITSFYIYYSTNDNSLKNTTLDYYQLVKQAFQIRAVCDSKFGARLNVTSFINLLVESSLVDSNQESLCVRSFLQAQCNPVVQWELDSIVFAEFLEALSRVAIKAIEDSSGLSEAKKIRMAFDFLTELLSQTDPRK